MKRTRDVPTTIRVSLNGQTFGEWTVIGFVETRKGGTIWRCQCSCGAMHDVHHGNLRNGTSTRCVRCNLTAHGMSREPTFFAWQRTRDNRIANWNDFRVFFADMGERPEGKILFRFNADKPHGPDNSVWLTKKEQSLRNRRQRCEALANELGRSDIEYLMTLSRARIWQLRQKIADSCEQ